MKKAGIFIFTVIILLSWFGLKGENDPYIWLEQVEGEKAIKWAKEQNAESVSALESVPGFKELYNRILEILNSDKRIPYAGKRGKYLYNFWRDKDHSRGIYRRTTLEEYKKENPKWDIILDIDKLAEKEKKNWVYKGMRALYPDYDIALVNLSRGGADAAVVREFSISKKNFVENGFYIPEAKSIVTWIDKDTLFVGTDFGEGSLTASGYPRIVKIWKRGTKLKDAKTIFEADKKSVYAYGSRFFSEDGNLDMIVEAKTFYSTDKYLLKNDKLIKLDVPSDAEITGYFKKQLIIWLKSDLKKGEKVYKKGSVLIGKLDDILSKKIDYFTLMEPGERMSISSVRTTKNLVLITVLDNVVSKLYKFHIGSDGKWVREIVKIKDNGTLGVFNTNEKSDDYFVNFENFLTPDSLYLVPEKTGNPEILKSLSHFFDPEPFNVKQFEAISADGTRIPYFIIMRKDTKFDGSNPTLLYGYGGFLISEKPFYSATVGKVWLEKGGIFVLANIRGGGEFGPAWHQAALKENRKKSFEDFIAIAEDLISRKITSPGKLAIKGGSNGGLLVGAVFVMRPDLFNAVVCQVPLLDMKRYTKLLAGASWAAEYGDPDDPEMWKYIKTYSPYHNLKKGAGYPEVFFTTSTRDDRVHPGHARKMVARMKGMGYKVFYYENMEGGHAGAANNKQKAYMSALGYAYLYKKLMGK